MAIRMIVKVVIGGRFYFQQNSATREHGLCELAAGERKLNLANVTS